MNSTAPGATEESPDLFLAGRLRLLQPASGHRAGTDALLLAAAAPETCGLILDAGAGTGAAGLALALRCPQARIDLVEIDPATAGLAARNIALNGMAGRGRAVVADLLSAKARRAAGLADGQAEIVLTNPPWLAPSSARPSPDADRSRAHVEGTGGLEAWLRACAALLAPGGTLVMIHRADRLADILAACAGRVGGLAVRPVHPRAEADAIRLIVTGRKGSRAPLALRPPLVLHDADGGFTPRAEALHRGEAVLA